MNTPHSMDIYGSNISMTSAHPSARPAKSDRGAKCGNDPFEEPVILCSRSLSPKRSLDKGTQGPGHENGGNSWDLFRPETQGRGHGNGGNMCKLWGNCESLGYIHYTKLSVLQCALFHAPKTLFGPGKTEPQNEVPF